MVPIPIGITMVITIAVNGINVTNASSDNRGYSGYRTACSYGIHVINTRLWICIPVFLC
jgi:hypothetical protein